MSGQYAYDVKQAAQAVLAALNLSPVTPAAVVVRKLPAVDERLDLLPALFICNSEQPETNVPAGFVSFAVSYFVDFVLVVPAHRDRVENLDALDRVRQSVRKAFDNPSLAGVPSVWNTRYAPTPPYDRRRFSQNYDYSFVTIEFMSQE